MKIKSLPPHYFTRFELALWGVSAGLIVLSFLLFDQSGILKLLASLVGVTSLIFCAKGNPFGQFLMILFSLCYGVISYSFSYYGEMATYLGMTMPMAAVSLITWLRHPFGEDHSQVQVNRLKKRELPLMCVLTALVTVLFYFILRSLHTANLFPSTLSVTTSFAAVYLTFRRSPYFAAAYALNDIILIILWSMASIDNIGYIPVVVCFSAFLVNDLYGFLNWKAMEKTQSEAK